MSIRITLLTLLVIGLAVYAWRDWYISLCGLILLTAISQHPDMPHTVGGIPGLNPWNLLLGVIAIAALVHPGALASQIIAGPSALTLQIKRETHE